MLPAADEHIALIEQMPGAKTGRRGLPRDYPDGHVLASHVAVGQSGLLAHIAEMQSAPQSLGRFVATLPPTARRRSAFLLRDHKSPCLRQFRSLGIAIRRQCL